MANYSIAHLAQGEYDDGPIAQSPLAINNYSPFATFESLLPSPLIFSGTKDDCAFIATDSKVIWPMSTNSARNYDVGDGVVGATVDDGIIVGIDCIVVSDLSSLCEKTKFIIARVVVL